MISQMLGDPWLGNFEAQNNGKQPTVIVGQINNLSSEHVNVQTFVDDMQRELINSNIVPISVAVKRARENTFNRKVRIFLIQYA